ncbi:hypothetical protein EFE32_07110 [Lactococcus lactis subsp. lactis]|nr:hypothetical protein [Lactococcus lactis subsp. lactis]
MYTPDGSDTMFNATWKLVEAKYPEVIESGTLTFNDLVEGMSALSIIGDNSPSNMAFKDFFVYVAQVATGQLILEEFGEITGYVNTRPITDFNIYPGYVLDTAGFENNLNQLITDSNQKLAIPFVKIDSKTTIYYIMDDGTSAFDDRTILRIQL